MAKYNKHPWLEIYPIQKKSTKLIIGTHPPKPYRGCLSFFYGNSYEFWRFMELTYQNFRFFDDELKPNLDFILNWLDKNDFSITDMIQHTYDDNKFSVDSDIIIDDYKSQLNQYLYDWLLNSNVNKIYFTSFSEGKSAYDLFRKWVKIHFNKRLPKGREIINQNNNHKLKIFDKEVELIMLYSPSPAARRGIPRSQPYIKWLKENEDVKNPIDEFRVYWYRKYLL
jgi:G:T/U-mismatch repair DNA glycosylase